VDRHGGLQIVAGCRLAGAINNSGKIVGTASNGNATICGENDFGRAGFAASINSAGDSVGFENPQPGTDAANAILFPSP
jgi:hypothetical protein